MNPRTLIAGSLILLLALGCHKKTLVPILDQYGPPGTGGTAGSLNPTDYLLTSVVPQPTAMPANSYVWYFYYDNDHRLSEYKVVYNFSGGTAYLNGMPLPEPPVTSTTTYYLQYVNNRVSVVRRDTDETDSLSYNNLGQLVMETLKGNVDSIRLFSYDDRGNLIRIKGAGPHSHLYIDTLMYDTTGDLTAEADSTFSTPAWQVSRISWSGFDSSINFVKTINGFPIDYVQGINNMLLGVLPTCPHNFGSITFVPPPVQSQPSSTELYTYTYNDAKLPVSMTNNFGYSWNLTYQKYK